MPDIMKIQKRAERFVLLFRYDEAVIDLCKKLPGRRWIGSARVWTCDGTVLSAVMIDRLFRQGLGMELATDQAFDELLAQGLETEAIADDNRLAKEEGIETDHIPDDLIKSIGPDGKPQALMEKQKQALALSHNAPWFAYFMDQGTGKTATCLADIEWLFRQGLIDRVIWMTIADCRADICDNRPWKLQEECDAIRKFMPREVNAVTWFAAPKLFDKRAIKDFWLAVPQQGVLDFLVINYEALQVARAYDMLMNFAQGGNTIMVCDESTRIKARPKQTIKTGPQNRSSRAMAVRAHCKYARIMTGTPVIKKPLDAWSQLIFLDRSVMPWGSYTAFSADLAIMGQHFDQVLEYKPEGLKELSRVIAGCSFRVLKSECLDLPAKVYQTVRVQMDRDQRQAYDDMKNHATVALKDGTEIMPIADWDGEDVKMLEAPIILTKLMRMQQITSGFITELDEERKPIKIHDLVAPEKNPKFLAAMRLIQDRGDQKCWFWGRFDHELEMFAQLLDQAGISHCVYKGSTPTSKRKEIREGYQAGRYDVGVGNADCAGVGLNLFAGSLVGYLSNGFKAEARVQSEDRFHRIGQTNRVTYYDIEVPGTIDVHVRRTLRMNVDISQQVMRDGVSAWI